MEVLEILEILEVLKIPEILGILEIIGILKVMGIRGILLEFALTLLILNERCMSQSVLHCQRLRQSLEVIISRCCIVSGCDSL